MESKTEEYISNDEVDIMTMANKKMETTDDEKSTLHEEKVFNLGCEVKSPRVDYEAIGEFCFESDTLALKGNNDYKNVLEAIVILEAQKEQAVKDLASLLTLQEKALADPIDFVEKLKKKEDMNMPTSQRIHPVPSIDWGKYALSGDPSAFRKRQLSKIASDVKKNLKRKLKTLVALPEVEVDCWSSAEEKQLEELLILYHAKSNHSVQWEKIANCLNNRTVSQVEARAKKCFPLLIGSFSENEPGSGNCYIRKSGRVTRRSSQQTNMDRNGYQEPPNADEDYLDSKNGISDDDDEIDPELHNTVEYQELLLYKKLLKKRIKSSTMAQHLGFKCAWCKTEPILGVRYHCIDCNHASVDFCEDCIGGAYEIDQHAGDHQFEEIQHSNTGFLDRDYMHFLGNDYNYLDPNYMPAT